MGSTQTLAPPSPRFSGPLYNSKQVFPISILIHHRTDTSGLQTRSSSPSLCPKVPSITPQRSSSASHWPKAPEPAFFRPSYQILIPLLPIRHRNFAVLCKPPILLATAASQFSAACSRKAAASDGSPPATASSNVHALLRRPPVSPAAAASWLATTSRSARAAPAAATGSRGYRRSDSAQAQVHRPPSCRRHPARRFDRLASAFRRWRSQRGSDSVDPRRRGRCRNFRDSIREMEGCSHHRHGLGP